jgi:hypothetical protein
MHRLPPSCAPGTAADQMCHIPIWAGQPADRRQDRARTHGSRTAADIAVGPGVTVQARLGAQRWRSRVPTERCWRAAVIDPELAGWLT